MPNPFPANSLFFLKACCFWVFLFIGSAAYSQYTDIINSNNPGNTMGAYSVGSGVYQVEGRFYVDRFRVNSIPNESLFNNSMISLRIGLFKEALEVIYDGAYTVQFRSSPTFGQPVDIVQGLLVNRLGAKYMLYDPFRNPDNRPINVYSWKANNRFKWRNLLPAVALYAGANIGLKSSPYLVDYPSAAPRVVIITQSTLTPKMVLIVNGVYDFIGAKSLVTKTSLEEKSLIVSLSRAIERKWGVFIEGQYSVYQSYEEQILRAGGAYLFNKNFQIDVFGGLNFQENPEKVFAGMGFSYRIDKHKIR
jgi:hypothetical protein